MKNLARALTSYETKGFSFGKHFRKKRIKHLLKIIEEVHRQKNEVRILDIGGTAQYWNIVDRQFLCDKQVSIVGINLDSSQNGGDTEHYTYKVGDATLNLWEKFDKGDFDIIHSNSVIEHVGDWDKMKSFAKNINDFDGYHYVQTPNFWFFLEPHCMTPFFHFLPKPIRVSLVMRFQLGHWRKADGVSDAVDIVESARLLDKKMMQALFYDSEIIKEKVLFFTKSITAIKR